MMAVAETAVWSVQKDGVVQAFSERLTKLQKLGDHRQPRVTLLCQQEQ